MIKALSLVATCMAVISFSGFAAEAPSTAAANSYEQNVVRLSKITVSPEYLDQYKVFAAEVGRESMKREPGVRVLYSMQEKKNPTRFAILEIYANQEAYKHHIQTPHFRKYKEGTMHMVTSLELIDCDALVPEALIKPQQYLIRIQKQPPPEAVLQQYRVRAASIQESFGRMTLDAISFICPFVSKKTQMTVRQL